MFEACNVSVIKSDIFWSNSDQMSSLMMQKKVTHVSFAGIKLGFV